MAPMLQLANRVAEAMEEEFPDKTVQVLAYQWTRHPPKHMRPRPNMLVMLCSIECCFAHPLATCDENKKFRDDIEEWSKISPRLWIWNYGINFSHPLIPFPNLRVIGPNIRFYSAHNAKGVFEQCSSTTPGTEFAELRGYILAKCLWNPNYDSNLAMNEFLGAYYGKAAKPIRKYIDLLHDKVESENIHIKVHTKECTAPYLPYLTSGLLTNADEIWQKAELLVADNPDVLRRVKLSRMSVDYAIVERARSMVREKVPMEDRFMRLAKSRVDPFLNILKSSKLKHLKSWPNKRSKNLTPLYCRKVREELGKNVH